jgi:hypothetical protein
VTFEVVEIAFQHEKTQPPHISNKNAGGMDGISYSCRRLKMPRESYFCAKVMQGGRSLLSEAEKPPTPSRIQRLLVAERNAGAPIGKASG